MVNIYLAFLIKKYNLIYIVDLAIGAYKSAHVVVLKTQPIVEIIPKLFSNISTINTDTKRIEIFYCITYNSKDVLTSLELDITLIITSKNVIFEDGKYIAMASRVFLENTEGCNSVIASPQV